MLDTVTVTIRRNRDFITLLWLVTIILAVPYLDDTRFGTLLLVMLVTAFLISALYSVSDTPSRVAVGFLLAIPSLLCAWTYLFRPTPEIFIALLISLAVFLVFILFSVLRKVVTAREVTLIELFRAVMVYMMIGLAYGLIYLTLETHSPHSFQFNTGAADPESLLYFSFVALSTSGFGDIVAVSPVARSLVTLELLTGVFYLAVLIGFLVSAHYSSRISHPREAWKEEGTGTIRRFRVPLLSSGGPLTILAIAVLLNMASSVVTVAAEIPLFLDTWGTSFAVIMAGFPVGALAGILYNLIMAGTIWETSSLVFAGSSLLVAALTWGFWKKGWVDLRRPERLIAVGVTTGVANAAFTVFITLVLTLPPYVGTLSVYESILRYLGNPQAALVVMELLVEIIDKTFSIVLAAVAATFFTVFFRREMNREGRERSPEDS